MTADKLGRGGVPESASAPRTQRARWMLLLRIGFSAAAIAWLVLTFDWAVIAAQLALVRWPIALAALAVFSLWVLPCSQRWRQIAGACGYPIRLRESARAYFVGSFFNAFLPTGRGGDVVRALTVARANQYSAAGIMATVFVERLIGFFVALSFVIAAGIFALSRVEALRPALVSAGILAAAILIAALIAASRPVRSAARVLMMKLAGARMGPIAADISRVIGVAGRNPWLLMSQAAYSTLNQLALVVSGFILASAIPGFDAPWYAFPFVIPLIFVAGLLPSIGGYGVREVGYVVALGWFGVNPEAAAIYSLLQLLFLWIMSLVGAVVFMTGSARPRAAGQGATGAQAADGAERAL